MLKVIELGSWAGAGFDSPVHMVKLSSRGLIGNDRSDFLKIASFAALNFHFCVRTSPGQPYFLQDFRISYHVFSRTC